MCVRVLPLSVDDGYQQHQNGQNGQGEHKKRKGVSVVRDHINNRNKQQKQKIACVCLIAMHVVVRCYAVWVCCLSISLSLYLSLCILISPHSVSLSLSLTRTKRTRQKGVDRREDATKTLSFLLITTLTFFFFFPSSFHPLRLSFHSFLSLLFLLSTKTHTHTLPLNSYHIHIISPWSKVNNNTNNNTACLYFWTPSYIHPTQHNTTQHLTYPLSSLLSPESISS